MSLNNWTYSPTGATADALAYLQYLESKESGHESFSPGNSSANRVLICNWLYRPQFMDALLGYSYLDANNKIKRITPDPHPEIDNFYATDASVEGKGVLGKNDGGSISWNCAYVSTNYKPLTYRIQEDSQITTELDRYVTRAFSFSSDYLTVQGNMRWVTRPTHDALSAQPGRISGTMSMQYTWHEIPGKIANPFSVPNINTICNCFGRVNSTTFDPNGTACPPGTVLFIGVDPKMETPKLSDNTYYWEIQLSFLYRNNGTAADGQTAGHNYIFDTTNNRYDKVTSDGTSGGTPIYQSADLNSLFTIT